MNGETDNLANCKILQLSSQDLKFLEAVDITYQKDSITSPNVMLLDLGTSSSQCFSTNAVTGDFFDWIKQAMGSTLESINYPVFEIWTFKLST
jgi:hypothetical protein